MKKMLLLIAFLVSACWAFASSRLETGQGTKPENKEQFCVICQECNGLNYCVRAPNCLIAAAHLLLILFEEDCLGEPVPTT